MNYIHDVDLIFLNDDILQDLMYATTSNFTGVVVDGYIAKRAIATRQSAQALNQVQKMVQEQGYALLVKDTYRPHRAVHFFNTIWKDMPDNPKMKSYYYPDLKKTDLFENGYLAKHYSRHSSGSTVDLTLVDLETKQEIDMGTPVDFLGEASHVDFDELTAVQQENRAILTAAMKQNGFKGMSTEWWHFTLIDEPFVNQSFDFVYDDEGRIVSGSIEPICW